jgi:hypothetical protein
MRQMQIEILADVSSQAVQSPFLPCPRTWPEGEKCKLSTGTKLLMQGTRHAVIAPRAVAAVL